MTPSHKELHDLGALALKLLGCGGRPRYMITSASNERVKYVHALARRKTRQEEGRFVVEGLRLIEEAIRAHVTPDFIFYTTDLDERGQKLIERLHASGVTCLDVTPGVMKLCAETETPPGLLAVLPMSGATLPIRPTLSVVADALRDPGNLGTLIRATAAAGADELLLGPGTVDAYNPKVVRGAMGNHFRLPMTAFTWPAIAARLNGMSVWLADARGALPYTEVDWTRPSALIVSGEADGASAEAQNLATGRVFIPMQNSVESLNAAVAAAVILFEAQRQRRAAAPPAR
jgi:TrmH family RNA methyltransferase